MILRTKTNRRKKEKLKNIETWRRNELRTKFDGRNG
jgi:hypothetical protein